MNASLQNVRNKPEMTLKLAKKIAARIEAEAEKIGVNAVIVIADSGARPVLCYAMDKAFIASYDIAMGKAYTCASLKMPTKVLKNLAQPGGDLYGIQNTNEGKIVIFGGGEPLFAGGECIGAVAVSGGSEAEDTYLGEVGLLAFNDEI